MCGMCGVTIRMRLHSESASQIYEVTSCRGGNCDFQLFLHC